jgi:hypothetical protein
LVDDFERLPDDAKNQVVLKLSRSDDENIVAYAAMTTANNYSKLPRDISNEVLLTIANFPSRGGLIAYYLTSAIIANYHKLHDNIKNIIPELLSDNDTALWAFNALADNFDKLPENVSDWLFNILEYEPKKVKGLDYVIDIVEMIVAKYDKLPENVSNSLFNVLEDKLKQFTDLRRCDAETLDRMVRVLDANYDKLPVNIRNDLLAKLWKNKKSAKDVAWVVAANYDKLPGSLRDDLLISLRKP